MRRCSLYTYCVPGYTIFTVEQSEKSLFCLTGAWRGARAGREGLGLYGVADPLQSKGGCARGTGCSGYGFGIALWSFRLIHEGIRLIYEGLRLIDEGFKVDR